MKRILRSTAIALLALTGAMTHAAEVSEEKARAAAAELAQSCTRPTEPTIPDGSTADQEAMATAGSDVRAFVGDTQEYLKCIEGREQGYGEEITQAQQAVINAIYNAGVDAMQGAADEFNTELDAYRKVHGSGE
jgi:hypothetical protein